MSYCTAEDVLDGPLKAMDLSNIGAERDDQLAYIEDLLDATKLILDAEAGRDFDLHENDVVLLDGTNADRVILWKDDNTLCVPVIAVSEVKVYGRTINITNLFVDNRIGRLGFQYNVQDRVFIHRSLRGSLWTFPQDFQNVEVTLDWGFTEPPADVKKAQSFLTAGLVLVTSGGGLSGGVRELEISDFRVVYGTTGPYASQISAWNTIIDALLKQYRTGRHSGG